MKLYGIIMLPYFFQQFIIRTQKNIYCRSLCRLSLKVAKSSEINPLWKGLAVSSNKYFIQVFSLPKNGYNNNLTCGLINRKKYAVPSFDIANSNTTLSIKIRTKKPCLF